MIRREISSPVRRVAYCLVAILKCLKWATYHCLSEYGGGSVRRSARRGESSRLSSDQVASTSDMRQRISSRGNILAGATHNDDTSNVSPVAGGTVGVLDDDGELSDCCVVRLV